MAEELKSFKRDWESWSVTERVTAIGIAALAVVALVGGTVGTLVL